MLAGIVIIAVVAGLVTMTVVVDGAGRIKVW